MRGFAYPNATGTTFLGCGRYRVSAQGKQDEENVAFPNMGKLAQVVAAALFFAPALTQSSAQIYESKDESEQRYSGDSMGLAYFLALLYKTWHVRKPFRDLAGHIWCTGEIAKQEGFPPNLETVEPNAFAIKLLAFLAAETPGAEPPRLFLVPATNLTVVKHWCQTPQQAQQDLGPEKFTKLRGVQGPFQPATILDVSAFGRRVRAGSTEVFNPKTVVELQAHDLRQLIDILFERPTDPELTQWFDSLTTLLQQRQITDECYWEVLTYAVQQSLDHVETAEELLARLHDQPRDVLKRRLYFKGAIEPDAISKTPLAVAASTSEASWATPTLRVQQVLVAIRDGLLLCRKELGLRFILIPPGTVPAGPTNPAAYYLAQTPVSKAVWSWIMEHDTLGGASAGQHAQDNLSVYAILTFCERATEQCRQQGRHAMFAIPPLALWLFALAVHAETLGLEALRGTLDQCCQRRGPTTRPEYVMHGGRYPDPEPCPDTDPPERSLGFRPVLIPGVPDPAARDEAIRL